MVVFTNITNAAKALQPAGNEAAGLLAAFASPLAAPAPLSKVTVVMQVILSLVFVVAGLAIIFTNGDNSDLVGVAGGLLGAVSSYWFAPSLA
jgi:hypothetical protein